MWSFRLAVRSDVNSVIDSRLLKEVQLTGSISDCIVWFVQLALSGSLVPSPNAPTPRLLVLLVCMNSNWFGWLRFSDGRRFKKPSHINTLHTWLSHPFHKLFGDNVFIETTGYVCGYRIKRYCMYFHCACRLDVRVLPGLHIALHAWCAHSLTTCMYVHVVKHAHMCYDPCTRFDLTIMIIYGNFEHYSHKFQAIPNILETVQHRSWSSVNALMRPLMRVGAHALAATFAISAISGASVCVQTNHDLPA